MSRSPRPQTARFRFEDLFVLDLANNHQGDVEHGRRIIRACAEVAAGMNERAAIKFQFRDLPAFVHPAAREKSDNKHVPRFLSTKLSWDAFADLVAEVKAGGLLAACTPFDEASVDRIVELGFDIIKVASCSARDWPLLERVAASGLPVIASTGGLLQDEVDDLVSFFEHRASDFALMHCVSIYPTPDEACNLANVDAFKTRYPGRVIGWSTHENPADTVHVGLAVALGARMFERHVGIATDDIALNAYSATPEQVRAWMEAAGRARRILGSGSRRPPLPEEKAAIDGLKRGVFARGDLAAGAALTGDDVYFAFPCGDGQLASGEWTDGMATLNAVAADAPLRPEDLAIPPKGEEMIIKKAVHEVKALLANARVPLSHEFTTEYSHHYGVANFREVGAVLITVVNRDYAKKIIVQLPDQMHPLHYHRLKEETFVVVHGELIIELDGVERLLIPGDTVTVRPGVWHQFRTGTGCVFEEISTTHHKSDSVYRDPAIARLEPDERKTVVDHWGRFQLREAIEHRHAGQTRD